MVWLLGLTGVAVVAGTNRKWLLVAVGCCWLLLVAISPTPSLKILKEYVPSFLKIFNEWTNNPFVEDTQGFLVQGILSIFKKGRV